MSLQAIGIRPKRIRQVCGLKASKFFNTWRDDTRQEDLRILDATPRELARAIMSGGAPRKEPAPDEPEKDGDPK